MTTRSFYHPKSIQGALLLQQTIGRRRLLEELLAFLHQTADFSRQTAQPWLLRGVRGVGKTHFLSILAERLREEGFFQEAFELVWLPETETNEIYSVGTLLRSLVEQIALSSSRGPAPGPPWVSQGLRRVLERYAGDLAIFREDMLEIVKMYAQKSGKRLVVFIENLDLILREFSPRTRPQEEAAFRSILQDQKEIIWICTSPFLRTDATHDPRRPLYGLFVERAIPALNEEETWELWRIAKQKTLQVGDSYAFFNMEDDVSVSFEMFTKQKALYQLTGGKPRNIWILAEWMPDQGDVHAFQEALLRVLDMQTTFFEQEFLSVAPRERTILARLALSEHNLDLQEIARETALPPKSLSTHLSRLVDGGYLSRYELKKEKKTLFFLNDRLFRLWYRFRKYGRKDDLWNDFLGLWYAVASPQAQAAIWQHRTQTKSAFFLSPFSQEWFFSILFSKFYFRKMSLFSSKKQPSEQEMLFESLEIPMHPGGEAGHLIRQVLKPFPQDAVWRDSCSLTKEEQDLFRAVEGLFFEEKEQEAASVLFQAWSQRKDRIFSWLFVCLSQTWFSLCLSSKGSLREAELMARWALSNAERLEYLEIQGFVHARATFVLLVVSFLSLDFEETQRLSKLWKGGTEQDRFWVMGLGYLACFSSRMFSWLRSGKVDEADAQKAHESWGEWLLAAEVIDSEEEQFAVFLALCWGILISAFFRPFTIPIQQNVTPQQANRTEWSVWLRDTKQIFAKQSGGSAGIADLIAQIKKNPLFFGAKKDLVEKEWKKFEPLVELFVSRAEWFWEKESVADWLFFGAGDLRAFFDLLPVEWREVGRNVSSLLLGYASARVDLEWGAFRFLAELKSAVHDRYVGFLALLLLRALWPVLPMTENWRTEFEGMEKLIEERKLPIHETTGQVLQMYVEVSKIEMRYQQGLSAQEEEEMWLRWPEPLRTSLRVLVQKFAEERKAAKERSDNLQSKHPEA